MATAESPNTNVSNSTTKNLVNTGSGLSFVRDFYQGMTVVYSLLSIAIFVPSLVLLFVLLSSSSFRKNLRHQLLVSMTVGNLLVGVFQMTFMAESFSINTVNLHDCEVYLVLSTLVQARSHLVLHWGLVELSLLYLARLHSFKGPASLTLLPQVLQRAVQPLIVCLPWLIAVVGMVPMVVTGIHESTYKMWKFSRCLVIFKEWFENAMQVVFLYPPLVLLIALSIAMPILYRCANGGGGGGGGRRRGEGGRGEGSEGEGAAEEGGGGGGVELERELTGTHEKPESPFVFLLSALLAIIGALFNLLWTWEWIGRLPSLKLKIAVYYSLTLVRDVTPFALTLVWLLLFREVKTRLLELLALLPFSPDWFSKRSAVGRAGGGRTTCVTFRELNDD